MGQRKSSWHAISAITVLKYEQGCGVHECMVNYFFGDSEYVTKIVYILQDIPECRKGKIPSVLMQYDTFVASFYSNH